VAGRLGLGKGVEGDDRLRSSSAVGGKLGGQGAFADISRSLMKLEHDPEKWAPVFGKDHAPIIRWSGMPIRRKVILL
jgi:hypothetical protein